jgi:hypothetical protein
MLTSASLRCRRSAPLALIATPPPPPLLAITCLDFAKHHQIGTLFKDMKSVIYQSFESSALSTLSSSGPIHLTLRPHLEVIFARFNKDILMTVNAKVEQVKEKMKENVEKALTNVEVLEEMEIKAESMVNQAKLFEKRSGSVLWMMRCRYIKVTALLGLMVGCLLAYLIYFIYTKVHTPSTNVNVTTTPATTTGTGGSTSTATGASKYMTNEG